jgi:hypothetical protein
VTEDTESDRLADHLLDQAAERRLERELDAAARRKGRSQTRASCRAKGLRQVAVWLTEEQCRRLGAICDDDGYDRATVLGAYIDQEWEDRAGER